MSECDKSALELAKSAEWAALQRLVSAHPVRAEELDDFGMMPLHWTCTDTNVPLRAAKVLLDAFPLAAVLKNKGGLVPLHIAVKANVKPEVLRALVAARDDALVIETGAGETPADLALACGLANDKVTLLSLAEQQLRASGRAPPRPSNRYKSLLAAMAAPLHDTNMNDAHHSPSSLNGGHGSRRSSASSLASGDSGWVLTGTSSNSLSSNGGGVNASGGNTVAQLLAAVPLPPRWRLDSRCHICQVKFTYFKNRHHCRSCGESVCRTHSNRRVALKHIGVSTPQRVCILCYDELREHGKPASAVVNMYANRKDAPTKDARTKTPPHSQSFYSDKHKHQPQNAAATAAPRTSPVLRPTRSGLALTAAGASTARRVDVNDLVDTTLVDSDDDSDDDNDPRSASTRSGRPRAWTGQDVGGHHHHHHQQQTHHQKQQSHARELQTHLQALQLSKSALEQQLAAGTRELARGRAERLANERTVAAMRADRMLDISRLPPDNDGGDGDGDDDTGDSDDSASLPLDAELDAAVDAALTSNHVGLALFERNEYSSAIREFRRSVALNDQDPDVWYNLARALHGAGELVDAEAAVRRALEIVGRSYALLALLGKILHARGDDDASIDVFREALGLMDHGDDGDSDSDDDGDVGSATVGW